MKKYFVASFILLAVSVVAWGFSNYLKTRLTERNAVIETRTRLEAEAKKASAERVDSVLAKLSRITRLEELEKFAETDAKRLSKGEYQALSPVLRTKLFEANFRRAELLLGRAGDLLRSDNNHPSAKEYLERAQKIYEKMDQLLEEGVPERLGDSRANARLNYLKGVYFYRSLFFVKDPKAEAARVSELVGLSAKYLSTVFTSIPKEINAEYALEILQKKAQDMGAANSDSQAKLKLELLPSSKSSPGPTFAIEGFEEGRH
ncbi:MAG: hypothetical protein Q7R65_04200 [bacterium]|nr:hypothetical protein [bacterium]